MKRNTLPSFHRIFDKQAKLVLSGLLVVFFLFMGTGCITLPDTEVAQIQLNQVVAQVTPNQSISQTFTSRRSNLNGVSLWIYPKSLSGRVYIKLLTSGADSPLSTTELEISQLPEWGPTQIKFPPRPGSTGAEYRLEITSQEGSIKILGRDEDNYPEGEVFKNGTSFPGDIAFRLTYAYTWREFMGDLWGIADDMWLTLPLIVLLLFPGWIVLSIFSFITRMKLADHFDFGDHVALSLGLSLSILPLVMLWTTTANIAWTQKNVLIAGIVVLVVGILLLFIKYPLKLFKIDLYAGLLMAIFFLSLSVRLIMVRDMVAPAWVDPVHHGLLTRFILEAGKIPKSYAPHFPPDVSHYHVGFHVVLAAFMWLTNLDLLRAMLVLGQVLNALTVFAVFTFTKTFTENKTAALFAALITGIFTPLPAYYASWGGRFTQLTGLLILPIGFVWAKLARKGEQSRSWGLVFIAGLTYSGLFLVHYRVAAFLGLLLLVYVLVESIFPTPDDEETRLNVFKNLSIPLLRAGLLSIALTSPWFVPTVAGLFIPKSQAWSGEITPIFSDFNPRHLTIGLGTYTLILAGLGLLWAILHKKRFMLTLSLWIVILFGLANVGALALPGKAFINNVSVTISLFLPISILSGYFIQEVVDFCLSKYQGRWERIIRWGGSVLLIGLIAIGTLRTLTSLNPHTVFFHEADRETIAWIEENIPQEETILINPAIWGYGLYYGEDGGSWISPLAGNQTIPPPGLYGLGAEMRLYVNQFVLTVETTHKNPGELAQIMSGYGVQYIYLGRHGGILSPKLLRESVFFACVYENEGTWVFKVVKVP